MQKIRWLDKLVDELAKGKPLEKSCDKMDKFQKTNKVESGRSFHVEAFIG